MDTRTPREIKKPKFRVYLVAMGYWSNCGEAGTCETYQEPCRSCNSVDISPRPLGEPSCVNTLKQGDTNTIGFEISVNKLTNDFPDFKFQAPQISFLHEHNFTYSVFGFNILEDDIFGQAPLGFCFYILSNILKSTFPSFIIPCAYYACVFMRSAVVCWMLLL